MTAIPPIRSSRHDLLTMTAICAIAVLSAGCGEHRPTRVPVSGHVFIDGKPLTQGSIMLVPVDARPSSGMIDEQGRFTLACYDGEDGAVVGKHAVRVVSTETISEEAVKWLIPKKYANHQTSGLTADIDAPTNSLRIDLTWAGGAPFIEK